MRLNKTRSPQPFLQRHQHRIKSLHMANCQFRPVLFGQIDQLACFLCIHRDRFLNQHMLSAFQEGLRNRQVRGCGCHDARRIDRIHHLLKRPKRPCLALSGNFTRCIRVGIVHSYQLRLLEL